MYLSPGLLVPSKRSLPPLEFCRGVMPSQAANSRPDRNREGRATVAAMALAPMMPTPGAVAGNTILPLGVDRFGQSGDIPDLYRAYGIDTDAILDAAARACLTALRQTG
jgi:transketolase